MRGGVPAARGDGALQRTRTADPSKRRRLRPGQAAAAKSAALAHYFDLIWLLIGVAIIFLLSDWIEI